MTDVDYVEGRRSCDSAMTWDNRSPLLWQFYWTDSWVSMEPCLRVP